MKASNSDDPVQPSSIFDTIKIIIVTILCTIITMRVIPYLFPSSAPAEPIVTTPTTTPTVDDPHVVEPPDSDVPDVPEVNLSYRPRWIDEVSTQTLRIPSVDTLTQTERAADTPTGEIWIAPARGEKYHSRADCQWLKCAKMKKSYTPCNYCRTNQVRLAARLYTLREVVLEGRANKVHPLVEAHRSRIQPPPRHLLPQCHQGAPHQHGYRSSPAESSQRGDWRPRSDARQTPQRNSGQDDYELPDTYDEFRRQFGPGRHGRSG